jgi:hypothetical protein
LITFYLLITTQAIDKYFEVELVDFAHYKLLELDWEILEGLEEVLTVTHRLLKPAQALITSAGSSHFSAKSILQVNANLIMCHRDF